MSLTELIAQIDADFTARSSVTLTEPIALDRRKVASHGRFPRIICVPTNDTFAASQAAGGNEPVGKTRLCGCTAHIWGETLVALDSLINEFLISLAKAAKYHTLEGGSHNNAVGHETAGEHYELRFRAETPAATQPPYQLVNLTQFHIKDRLSGELMFEQDVPPL